MATVIAFDSVISRMLRRVDLTDGLCAGNGRSVSDAVCVVAAAGAVIIPAYLSHWVAR